MQENASHVISLPLFKLNLPERSLFEPQIKQLTEKSFALENRERRIKTTARYSHLSQDTLLDASNAVTRAVGHLFVPMLSASPAMQVQLTQ